MNATLMISAPTRQTSQAGESAAPSPVQQGGFFEGLFNSLAKKIAAGQDLDLNNPGFIGGLSEEPILGNMPQIDGGNLQKCSGPDNQSSGMRGLFLQIAQAGSASFGTLKSQQPGTLLSGNEISTEDFPNASLNSNGANQPLFKMTQKEGISIASSNSNEVSQSVFKGQLSEEAGGKNNQRLNNLISEQNIFPVSESNRLEPTVRMTDRSSQIGLAGLLKGTDIQAVRVSGEPLNIERESRLHATPNNQPSVFPQAVINKTENLALPEENTHDIFAGKTTEQSSFEKALLNQIFPKGSDGIGAQDSGSHFARLHGTDSTGTTTARMEHPGSSLPGAELRLPSGQTVSETRIIDQIVSRFNPNRNLESSSIQIKMHPEELGEVKLDLKIDHDRVTAQLLTQSQQVQEVLERHLPRLRSALEQQGFKLDQLQVNVDTSSSEEKGFSQQHFQQASTGQSNRWFQAVGEPGAEQEIPLMNQARSKASSGLSLRI